MSHKAITAVTNASPAVALVVPKNAAGLLTHHEGRHGNSD